MKQLFITQQHTPELQLFFAGWGMDERLADRPGTAECDCMICFDYHDLDFDPSPLTRYQSIRVAAWSMGVWVAGQALQRCSLKPEQSIAFNGTNFPIDDERGIPTAVFQGTLDGFSQQAWEKFQRRMCGTADRLQAFKAHAPARPWTDLRDELAALRDAVNDAGPSTWKWDKAIVGLHDRIFPSTNQLRAWPETACMTVNAAHHDALLLQELINGKGQLWTNI